jgi:hypothetical protein
LKMKNAMDSCSLFENLLKECDVLINDDEQRRRFAHLERTLLGKPLEDLDLPPIAVSAVKKARGTTPAELEAETKGVDECLKYLLTRFREYIVFARKDYVEGGKLHNQKDDPEARARASNCDGSNLAAEAAFSQNASLKALMPSLGALAMEAIVTAVNSGVPAYLETLLERGREAEARALLAVIKEARGSVQRFHRERDAQIAEHKEANIAQLMQQKAERERKKEATRVAAAAKERWNSAADIEEGIAGKSEADQLQALRDQLRLHRDALHCKINLRTGAKDKDTDKSVLVRELRRQLDEAIEAAAEREEEEVPAGPNYSGLLIGRYFEGKVSELFYKLSVDFAKNKRSPLGAPPADSEYYTYRWFLDRFLDAAFCSNGLRCIVCDYTDPEGILLCEGKER